MKKIITLAVLTSSLNVFAQGFPSKPITVVVGFPPGGGADTVTRIVTEKMSQILGQPIIVDNKPGAGTTLASNHVVRAAADGHTLLVTSGNIYGSDQQLFKNVRYEGEKNFTPISRWTNAPMLLAVNKSLPFNTTKDLIEYAKKNPDKLTYSSSGVGVITHLAGLSFENAAGLKMQHIPYKGGAPSLQAVAAGDVGLTFGTPPSVLPLAQGGRLKVLSVTTAQRSSLFPDLPGMADAGLKDYDFTFWFGLFGPAGLPADVTQKLFDASVTALNDPQVKEKLEKSGNSAAPSKSLVEFRQWAVLEGQKYKTLTEKSGATSE
jgi:tripartite-type tricarboxylate transporter receptor subunit TctC